MYFKQKSREELITELTDLQKKYNDVVTRHENKLKESRETELSLLANEANIKAIIENSLDSIWSIDRNYVIQYVNDVFIESFYNTFGIKLAKGVNILEALPPKLYSFWKEHYDRAFNKEHFVFEDHIELENVSIYIEVAMNPVILNGKVAGASCFGKNVTARKMAEIALQESEARFKALHNASFGGIAIHENGIILECNQGLSDITGYAQEELNGMDGLQLISPESRDLVRERIRTGYEKSYEVTGLRKNGEKFPIRIEARNVPYKGKIVRTTEFRDISEQVKTEIALKENEEIFNHFLMNSPVYVFFKDTEMRLLRLSRNYEQMLGKPLEKMAGRTLSDLFPSERTQAIEEDDKQILANGKPKIINEELNGKYYTTIKFPIFINNTPKYMAGYTIDITERKQAEDLLRSSEIAMKQASENWNRTFHAMHSGIALIDHNQVILQSNRAFQGFVNATEEDIANKTLSSLQPSIASLAIPVYKKMKKSKVCEKAEIDLKHHVFEFVFDPVFDESSEFSGAVFIMNDITQRKRDENIQHILHEITSSSMFENPLADMLVVVRNELSKVIDTTNFFVALLNNDNGKLQKVIFEDEKDDFVEWDAGKSLSGQVLKMGTALLLNSEEEAHFAAENNIELLGSPAACWLGVPILNSEKAIGVIVVQSYTDENAYDTSTIRLFKLIAHELSVVIERKKMIEDLVAAKVKAEESDRLKSAFLANMSHEIRTPMNGILGFADLLKQPKLSEEELQHFVGIIEKSGERMLNIINDLINISKIESGQMDINTSETNINEQFEFLYNFFLPETLQKGLKLSVFCPLPHSKAVIATDREKLYAVLTNLIKNAIKFTLNGCIKIGYQLSANEILFYVTDTGIGIPESKQKSIFERFVQVNSGRTVARHEGAGLGLSISKAYVEMLGGKIWIESSEGNGTSFYFTLPANNIIQSKDELATENITVSPNQNCNTTILIADDDEISIIYLKHLLREFNFNIIEARNGREAIDICKENKRISIILMDINMPEINGREATRHIRNILPDAKIIAQTAFAIDREIENYFRDFDSYITKPIKSDEMKKIISKYLA